MQTTETEALKTKTIYSWHADSFEEEPIIPLPQKGWFITIFGLLTFLCVTGLYFGLLP